MRLLKKMSKFAKASKPDLSEHRVRNTIKKIYSSLTSKQKADIKSLQVK